MNYKSITNLDVANKGYRNTLVISYIVLSIISVIFLLLTMFTWFRSYLDKEMKNMSLLQLNNTSQIVNTKLNTYHMILQNMFQEPIIRSSLYSDGSDSENELKISRYINSAVINDGSLDYAVLYKDGNIKQIIGPVYPNQVEQKQVVQHLLGSKNDKEVFYLQNEKNNQNRFYIFRTERDVFGEAPQRGVLFAINQRKLSNTLFSRNDPNNNYFIYDTAGNLLIQQGAHSVSLQNEVWGKILGSNSTDLQAVEHNGSDFYLISLEEKEFGLKFAQLINVSGISTTLREALGVSMLGVLFVILISSIAALFLAYFVSYPLRSFIKSLVANTDLQADNIGDNANLTKLTSERIISEISNISRQFNSDKVLSYFEDAPAKTTPPTELQIEGSEDRLVIVYVGSTEGKVSFDNQERLLEKLRSYFGESLNIQAFTEQNSPYSIITLKGKKQSVQSFV